MNRPKQTREIDERAWEDHNFTWKNNRGAGMFHGRWQSYGLPPVPGRGKPDKLKGGDRIGFTKVKITPDMVGKTIAVFTSLEIKSDGDTLHQGQKNWHNMVLLHGGISKIYYSDKIEEGEIK